jgi:mono/diheme cytochrome c family protein
MAMKRKQRFWRILLITGGGLILFLAAPVGIISLCQQSKAAPPWHGGDGYAGWAFYGREHLHGPHALAGTWYNLPGGGPVDGCGVDGCVIAGAKWKHHKACFDCYSHGGVAPCELGGSWFWTRSPEEERVAMASRFNRYCIRCHGVDGRGVWDIPGVPDFTNPRWQLSRSDDQIARIIIEGRGAVMPTFRGTLTLEEAWAMARYLRTFVPGSQASRPEVGQKEKTTPSEEKKTPPIEELPPPKAK